LGDAAGDALRILMAILVPPLFDKIFFKFFQSLHISNCIWWQRSGGGGVELAT
jgi:hypothetical protein